jgi:hypothetical protein
MLTFCFAFRFLFGVGDGLSRSLTDEDRFADVLEA